MLSHPLPVVALVSRYLTNKLIGRRPIPGRNHTIWLEQPKLLKHHPVLPTVSRGYPGPQGRLPTRYYPFRRSSAPEGAFPLDLHA
jgi:hypothetical protein